MKNDIHWKNILSYSIIIVPHLCYDHKTHADMIKSLLLDLAKGQTSNMDKIMRNLMQILAHEQYDMMRVKILSKYGNMHNNDVNYSLKLSNNNEFNG